MWENKVGAVEDGKSYNTVGTLFDDVKFLSVGAYYVIKSTDDIVEVTELESGNEDGTIVK